MIEHVLDLGNQLKKELDTSTDFEVQPYKDLLIVGMGGSGVAGDVLKLVLNETTQINVEVRKAYGIAEVAAERNPKCLFISYSGNTEETVEAVNDAIKYNLDWSVIKKDLNTSKWKKVLNDNVNDMYQGNCWGVPSFKITDEDGSNPYYVWGQDRMWLLKEEINRRLSSPQAK